MRCAYSVCAEDGEKFMAVWGIRVAYHLILLQVSEYLDSRAFSSRWGMLPRECQTKDWKARHKAICGKTFDFESAVKAAVPARLLSPVKLVHLPFKRTPSLVDHIRQLNLQPKADLVQTISQLDRQQFTTLHFPLKPVQILVWSHRETAMTTGDKAAVAKLFNSSSGFV